jgi:hypothetical protein
MDSKDPSIVEQVASTEEKRYMEHHQLQTNITTKM